MTVPLSTEIFTLVCVILTAASAAIAYQTLAQPLYVKTSKEDVFAQVCLNHSQFVYYYLFIIICLLLFI